MYDPEFRDLCVLFGDSFVRDIEFFSLGDLEALSYDALLELFLNDGVVPFVFSISLQLLDQILKSSLTSCLVGR